MDDNTVELLVESGVELLGILLHTLNTYQNIAGNNFALNVVEGDNVGIGIVIEIFTIDLDEVIIVAEEIADVAYLLALGLDDLRNPFFHLHLTFEIEVGVL